MKKILLTLFLFVLIFSHLNKTYAWEGMPTPPLHVEGNKLKDPTGNDVLLHGWMQPTSSWFNGNRWYSDPTNWLDINSVGTFLNMMNSIATLMSDTTPKYGADHGWYASFVRVNTDAIGGWNSSSGLTDTVQFNAWINNFVVPYAQFLSSRGLYFVLSATGPINTPNNGSRNAGVEEQKRLRQFWSTVAAAPGVKNANNIMFELMNEPVDIESSPGNGDWGNHQDKYYSAFTNWIQPVIDDIRKTGANNIIWVPTLEWQGTPSQWAKFPFTGSNIGVACHYYPAYGGVFNNHASVQNLWDNQYKPAADRWPMLITEMYWTPYPDEPSNLVNGTTAGFGNAIKKAIDNQGNVSYLIGFIGDLIEDMNKSLPKDCFLSSREGSQSYFQWLPAYSKFGPDDGTPKFKYAYVDNNEPQKIKLTLSHAIKNASSLSGFSVKIDNKEVDISNIQIGDSTNQLIIHLKDDANKDNDILLSYNNGNIVSIYNMDLAKIESAKVVNLLKGSSPILTNVKTSENGETLIATFNKKMQLPLDFFDFSFTYDFDGSDYVLFTDVSFLDSDSTTLVFSLLETVYADYKLALSYSGYNVLSADGGYLRDITNFSVKNLSAGLPVKIVSGKTGTDGSTLFLEFSKPMEFSDNQLKQLIFKVKGETVSLKDFFILNRNVIKFNLSGTLHYGDTLSISYQTGDITAADKGNLEKVEYIKVTNNTAQPQWMSLPRKIEAEKYLAHSGTQTENTSDEGGGLNIGWIDNGDWLEYAINNNTADTIFQISFRIASPSGNGRIDYYLNDKLIGGIAIPSTGGWQTWKTVVGNITIGRGKHYLKLVTTRGGFNLNYFDIKRIKTSVDVIKDNQIAVYPNPVSTEIMIRSGEFSFNKVEVVDIMGKTVISKSTQLVSDFRLPIDLKDGAYVVKISNGNVSLTSNIIVNNEFK